MDHRLLVTGSVLGRISQSCNLVSDLVSLLVLRRSNVSDRLLGDSVVSTSKALSASGDWKRRSIGIDSCGFQLLSNSLSVLGRTTCDHRPDILIPLVLDGSSFRRSAIVRSNPWSWTLCWTRELSCQRFSEDLRSEWPTGVSMLAETASLATLAARSDS